MPKQSSPLDQIAAKKTNKKELSASETDRLEQLQKELTLEEYAPYTLFTRNTVAEEEEEDFSLFNAWLHARELTAETRDSRLLCAFKNVTLDYLREKIGTKKFNCTFTLTLDLSKQGLYPLKNDYKKQWRHIKQQMRCFMGTYSYRYYMIPEYTKRGVVHAHGVIKFNSETYDDYCYDRTRWVRKMALKVGRNIQWTRINDIHKPYMPTESNVKIRKMQTFAHWIDGYCHKSNLRKRLGHSNQME